ncbi:MAG: EcsC family protein [Coleofasciculus sp. S288]|nr:EcsC family protein [Coleofasciculus sp. S288]
MTELTLDELAKQGNTDAIAALLNRVLAPKGVTAKAAIKNDCLNIVVEAVETPNKQECVALVRNVITRLQLGQVEAVTVYGRQPGDDIPDWHQKFLLEDGKAQAEESSPFAAFTKMVGGIGESISNTTSQAGKAIVETATGVGEVVGKTTLGTGKVVVDTASGVGKAVVETATGLGGAVAGVGGAIGSNASQAVKTAAGVGGTAAKRTYQILSQITEFVAGAPILRKVVDQVDLVKAENAVKKLKEKHPHETSRQIAHRIMVEKAIYAGGSGLVTSLVPGAAAALFAVDLAATSALQAEMVYQIAAAYGFDIRDPARRGEVLTVFGLALGGNQAIRAGLEFLQNAPVAGAAIGASTNAVMLYTVGYAACRFYEAKLNAEGTEASLAESKEATEAYLQTAIAQQIVMDQILVHVIVAGNPEKSWEDIVLELEALNINPASLAVIKHHINSPPPLERLLAQLNRDFAIPLLAQCQQVAQQDRITTLEEAKVIETIAQKFDIDLNVMQEQLSSS